MPLGEEDVHGVDLAFAKAERGGLGIEIHGLALGLVNAAQIDRELAVDEHPDVVVSGESEGFTALVAKAGRYLDGEVIVVRLPFVAEKLIVDGEESHVLVGIDARLGRRWRKRQTDGGREVHAGHIPVPLVEGIRAADRMRDPAVDRLVVWPQVRSHDATVVVQPLQRFHVREAGVEVANRGDQRGLLGQRCIARAPQVVGAGPVAAAADAGTGLHNRRDLTDSRFLVFAKLRALAAVVRTRKPGAGDDAGLPLLVLAFLGPLPAHALARTRNGRYLANLPGAVVAGLQAFAACRRTRARLAVYSAEVDVQASMVAGDANQGHQQRQTGGFHDGSGYSPERRSPHVKLPPCSLVNVYTTFRPDEGRANQT